MILCVILLQMHPLTALYDPLGSCYDKVPSVARGEVAVAKLLAGVLGSPLPGGANIQWSQDYRDAVSHSQMPTQDLRCQI